MSRKRELAAADGLACIDPLVATPANRDFD
jgi:hypothetical protein